MSTEHEESGVGEPKSEAPHARGRYVAPQVRRLGSVRELTLAGGSSVSDSAVNHTNSRG
jgi:hypothetical protein